MLQGHHIVITRPIEQSQSLADALRARGALPLFYPGFTYGPPDDPDTLDAALIEAAQGHYDAIILTSGQAAKVIKERLIALNLSLAGQTIWAVGPHTAAACQFDAIIRVPPPPLSPQSHDAYTLGEALASEGMEDKRLLLPQSPLATRSLVWGLGSSGINVTTVKAYSVIAGKGGDDVPDFLKRGLISAFTFFSGSAIEGVMVRLEVAGLSIDDVRNIPAVCFGGTTAAKGRSSGLNVWEGDTTYETFYRLLEHACAGDKRIPLMA